MHFPNHALEKSLGAFAVTTDEVVLPEGTAKELGCPNNKWTAALGDVTVTGATVEFFQGGKELTALERSETF